MNDKVDSHPVTRLGLATPNCVADDFGGEIVALNLGTGYYFSMRELAGAVWRDLAAGHAVEEVIGALSAIDPTLAGQAHRLVTEILNHGLMRAEPEARPSTVTLESQELAASGKNAIILEVYDDMRDLVLSDPIHEVAEEAGWPVRPEG